jgi:hypothetical protein
MRNSDDEEDFLIEKGGCHGWKMFTLKRGIHQSSKDI